MHLFYSYLYRVRVLKLDDPAASGFVIFISEQLHVCNLANFSPEQIFEILPAKIIWNVRHVDTSVGCFPATAIVPLPAAITASRVYAIGPVRSSITVALSTPVPVIIVLWLITVTMPIRAIVRTAK